MIKNIMNEQEEHMIDDILHITDDPKRDYTNDDLTKKRILEVINKLKNNGGLGDVSNNENDSEVAFCDSPIHDFDRCPLIKQTNNCKNCRYYN